MVKKKTKNNLDEGSAAAFLQREVKKKEKKKERQLKKDEYCQPCNDTNPVGKPREYKREQFRILTRRIGTESSCKYCSPCRLTIL